MADENLSNESVEEDADNSSEFIEGEFAEVDDPEFLNEQIKLLEQRRREALDRKKEESKLHERLPYSESGYKQPRDRKEFPIGVNPNGHPIFAYNSQGIPVCHALINYTGNDGKKLRRRCQNPILGPAGRCRVHNGFPKRGIEHGRFKTGEYASFFKDRALGQLLEAAQDPDYLNMQDELALNFVQITKILERTNSGFTESSLNKIKILSEELEALIFNSKMHQFKEVIGQEDWDRYFRPTYNLAETLVRTINGGVDEFRAFRNLNEALKVRKTLIDTDLKRKQIEQNNLSSDKVLSLFGTLCACVMQIFGPYKTELEQFASKLDEMALHPTYRNALNSGRTVGYSEAVSKGGKPIVVSGSVIDSEAEIEEESSEEEVNRAETRRQIEEGDFSKFSELKTKKIKLKL